MNDILKYTSGFVCDENHGYARFAGEAKNQYGFRQNTLYRYVFIRDSKTKAPRLVEIAAQENTTVWYLTYEVFKRLFVHTTHRQVDLFNINNKKES